MAIDELNHINIRTLLMEETKDFYVDVVGLEVGFRPPFSNPGYWLYCGGTAVVHLSPCDADSPRRTVAEGFGSGLDHIGLSARDLEGMERTLRERGIAYTKRLAAGGGMVQVFLHDPNGVQVELAFDAGREGVDAAGFTPVTSAGLGS